MTSTVILQQPIKLPLVSPAFRNDKQSGSFAQDGSGVVVWLRAGPNDYRAWNEVFGSSTGSLTNYGVYYRSRSGMTWEETWRTLNSGATMASFSAASGTPDNGEVCPNTAPFWNAAIQRWCTYTHGGGNFGPRFSQLWTSPDLSSFSGAGTWSKDTIVFSPDQTYEGTSQTTAHQLASDLKASPSGQSLIGFYRAGDSLTTPGGVALVLGAISNPRSLTKQGVVLQVVTKSNSGATNAAYQGMVSLEGNWSDDSNRCHMFFVGDNAGATAQSVCYAISDTLSQFTTQYTGSGVITGSGGNGADNIMVGQVSTLDDGDILLLAYGGYNLTATYTPTRLVTDSSGTPLRGNSLAYTPATRNTPASRPARHFTYVGSTATSSGGTIRQVGTLGSTTTRLSNQTLFWVYAEYKMPTLGANRTLYGENFNFNDHAYLVVNSSGKLLAEQRTPGGLTNDANLTSANRVDDNTWRAGVFVRSAAASWTLYDETGTALSTDTTSGITISPSTPTVTIGNWPAVDPSTVAYPDEPAFASIRRVVVGSGYTITPAQIVTLWNGGNTGGSLPAGSSATNTLDIRPGSGGAGNDTEVLNSLTVTNSQSPPPVNGQPAGVLANLAGGTTTSWAFPITVQAPAVGAISHTPVAVSSGHTHG